MTYEKDCLRELEINPFYMGKGEYMYLTQDVEESVGVSNIRTGYKGGAHGRGEYEYTTILKEAVSGFVPNVSLEGEPMTVAGYEIVNADKIAKEKAEYDARVEAKRKAAEKRLKAKEETAKKLKADLTDMRKELGVSQEDVASVSETLESKAFSKVRPKAVLILAAAIKDGKIPHPSTSGSVSTFHVLFAMSFTDTGGFVHDGERYYTTKGKRVKAKEGVALYYQATAKKLEADEKEDEGAEKLTTKKPRLDRSADASKLQHSRRSNGCSIG
jgi:hypothetical protein